MELAALPIIMSAAGSAVSAIGTIAAGQDAAKLGAMERDRLYTQGELNRRAANYEAAQLEARGTEELASAQRESQQYGRQKRMALSTLQARAAGSGFSATDPSTLSLGDEISKYGTLQEQMALYGGQSRRAGLQDSADARRFSGASAYDAALRSGDIAFEEGRARRNASYYSAAGTILGGASTMADKYAKLYPQKPTAGRYG